MSPDRKSSATIPVTPQTIDVCQPIFHKDLRNSPEGLQKTTERDNPHIATVHNQTTVSFQPAVNLSFSIATNV